MHSTFELFKRDHPIVVRVDVLHDLQPHLLVLVEADRARTKRLLQLGPRDATIAVCVENFESRLQVGLGEEFCRVDRRRDELSVVNVPISVHVGSAHHLEHLGLSHMEMPGNLTQVTLQLPQRYLSIIVRVTIEEQCPQLAEILRLEHHVGNNREHPLLERADLTEIGQILPHVYEH